MEYGELVSRWLGGNTRGMSEIAAKIYASKQRKTDTVHIYQISKLSHCDKYAVLKFKQI